MSDTTGFFLILIALAWVTAYFAARSTRKPPFDQFRESPAFQPKSRRAALVSATFWAGLTALLLFVTKR